MEGEGATAGDAHGTVDAFRVWQVHGKTAHVCCCLGCAHSLQELEQSCPMCRKPIEAVLRLFFA